MLKQLYANNASTTLASSVSPQDTTIQVASVAGFPQPGPNEFFPVTVDTGISREVIYVFGVSGSTFTNCLRGREDTVAQTYQPGTLIENRATRDTHASFARYQDRLFNVASVDVLEPPSNSDGNSYICTSPDDAGNPIVAVNKGTSTWRFVGHPITALSGAAQAGSTTTELAFAGAATSIAQPFAGKYLLQFTSGPNMGLVRSVTGSDSTGVTWSSPLPEAPAAGDTFEIYQSIASSINSLLEAADDALIFPIIFSD